MALELWWHGGHAVVRGRVCLRRERRLSSISGATPAGERQLHLGLTWSGRVKIEWKSGLASPRLRGCQKLQRERPGPAGLDSTRQLLGRQDGGATKPHPNDTDCLGPRVGQLERYVDGRFRCGSIVREDRREHRQLARAAVLRLPLDVPWVVAQVIGGKREGIRRRWLGGSTPSAEVDPMFAGRTPRSSIG